MREGPTIADIGSVVVDAVDRGASTVVVVAPGRSAGVVAREIEARLSERGSVARLTGRRRSTARDREAAGDGVDGEVVLVSDAQWIAERTLESVRAGLGRRSLVVVHRTCTVDGGLAAVHADAYEDGARFELVPTPLDELEIGGDPDTIDAAFAATAGWPDLIETWTTDGSLDAAVTIDLGLLDERGRFAAELLALGAEPSDLPALLDAPPREIDAVLEALTVEGFIRSGSMPPGVARAVLAVSSPARREHAVERLLDQTAPGSVIALAEALASVDDRSRAAAAVYRSAAAELVDVDVDRARRLLERSLAVGTREDQATGATVHIAAELDLRGGQPDAALRRLSDHDLGSDPELALLAAAAWHALGDLSAAIAPLRASSMSALETWAAIGAGEMPPTEPGDTTSGDESTSAALAAAVAGWWVGARDDVAAASERALVRFRASPARVWPVAPHEVVAILSSRIGDVERAADVLNTAVTERAGGRLHHRTVVLLAAWFAIRQGRLDDAAAALEEVGDENLTPRERWLRASVSCALAVRDPEPDEVAASAADAHAASAAIAFDQYDLELSGEVAAAVERAGIGHIDDVLRPFRTAAERPDVPAHVAFDLERVRLGAALSTDDVTTASRAARAVLAHEVRPPDGAATTRVAELVAGFVEGDVDVQRTTELADELAAAHRLHEAARLCGLAAVHSTDPKASRRLLKQSRALRLQRARVREERGPDRTVVRLSPQEERVARFVSDGLTYKAIAAELIISPKTVEHHVAHIRTKLGAGSRAELLAAIRAYFDVGPAGGASSDS